MRIWSSAGDTEIDFDSMANCFLAKEFLRLLRHHSLDHRQTLLIPIVTWAAPELEIQQFTQGIPLLMGDNCLCLADEIVIYSWKKRPAVFSYGGDVLKGIHGSEAEK